MTQHGRVLVADDDVAVRQSTVRILEALGYVVAEAQDGEEALEKLAAVAFEVIVLDVKMPRRDGISVVEAMDPAPPPPVVLLVSAYDIERDTRVRFGAKVHRVLRKPVPPSTLVTAIEEAVVVARSARAQARSVPSTCPNGSPNPSGLA